MQAWTNKEAFRPLVEAGPIAEHLSDEQIASAFDPGHHMRHVDTIFERVGID